MEVNSSLKKIKNRLIEVKENIINKRYSKESNKSKFTYKYQKIEEISTHYSTNYSNSELKIKLIELESKHSKIEEPKERALKISMISLIITLSFNFYNNIMTSGNQERISFKNKITQYENLKDTYWMKHLETESKINFTENILEKEQLKSYDNSLKKEIEIINNKIINEYENNRDGLNYFNSASIILKILFLGMMFYGGLILIEELRWIFKKREKSNLQIHIEVIKQLIS